MDDLKIFHADGSRGAHFRGPTSAHQRLARGWWIETPNGDLHGPFPHIAAAVDAARGLDIGLGSIDDDYDYPRECCCPTFCPIHG